MVRHGVEQGASLTARFARLGSLPAWALVAVVVLAYALVTWTSLQRLGDSTATDSAAFREYAEILDRTGRLPTEEETYEYALPPLVPVLGVAADRFVGWVDWAPGRPLAELPSPLRRGAWLVLAIGAVLAIALARRRTRWWYAGIAVAVVAGGLALLYGWAFAVEQAWAPMVLTSYLASLCLVGVSALVGREVWPTSTVKPALVAACVAALPATLRIGILFHPDSLFAALAVAALLVVLRAARRGWGWPHAVAAGALLGLCALTRQAAPAVMLTLGLATVLLGRRASLRFVVVATAATLVVAGPWWIHQTSRFGNPIQSNLDRPGYMLDRQPRSFYVSLPLPDLVTRPYRESFKNELLPKFHAELWSDWFGTIQNWLVVGRANKALASTQSVLGLVVDGLALAGLAIFGLPAVRRVFRRRPSDRDPVVAALAVYAVLPWLGFVATLVRFPQIDGDSIQAHYLLFLAPAFAVFGLLAADALWRIGPAWRMGLLTFVTLVAISYTGVLWTAF